MTEASNPCAKCGARERYKCGTCKPCAHERNCKHYEANKERVAEQNRKYYELNRERLLDKQRKKYEANPEKYIKAARAWEMANPEMASERHCKWVAANRDKVSNISRNWRKANPEKVRVNSQNRRARVKGNGGNLSKDIVQHLMIQQSGKCACCGTDLNLTGHHLDHIVPIALGGLNDDANVQLLTPTCNRRKGAVHPDDWAKTITPRRQQDPQLSDDQPTP